MHRESHRWYSARLGREIGTVVYGHWGPPLIAFPTSGGDEWEMERQGMIAALGEFIDAGRVKIFAVDSANADSWYDTGAHPSRRSYMQKQYDEYVRWEAIPFVQDHCRTPGIAVATMGASLGAYHAANTLFKHPGVVKRCFALSGVYDMRRFMDGAYDDNFYFNNPVDYLQSLTDPTILGHLASCDIHLATGSGPWEDSGPSYQLADLLRRKGLPCHLDNWGKDGGHDWPYWQRQMREYVGKL
jgi:esterase/lipase superfamily enzyme